MSKRYFIYLRREVEEIELAKSDWACTPPEDLERENGEERERSL